MLSTLRGLLLCCACCFFAGPLLAQTQEQPKPAEPAPSTAGAPDQNPEAANDPAKTEATQLLDEGRKLYDEGNYEAACQKFEASVRAKSGVGNRFQLANCYEKIGRTASAHALFLAVADATRALAQPDREKAAQERADALGPRLCRLLLNVKTTTEGLAVDLDGKPLPASDWGKPLAVDPGQHKASASAPGHEPWSATFDVRSDPCSVAVEVPALVQQKVTPPLAAVVGPAPDPAPREEPKPFMRRKGVATLLLGVGGAGLLTGIGMSALAAASSSDADKACADPAACTAGEAELRSTLDADASSARTWAYVGFGTGIAAVACAAYLHFTDPSRSSDSEARSRSKRRVTLRASLGPMKTGFGGNLAGTF